MFPPVFLRSMHPCCLGLLSLTLGSRILSLLEGNVQNISFFYFGRKDVIAKWGRGRERSGVVNFYVLRAGMKHRIGRQVCSASIIIVQDKLKYILKKQQKHGVN